MGDFEGIEFVRVFVYFRVEVFSFVCIVELFGSFKIFVVWGLFDFRR